MSQPRARAVGNAVFLEYPDAPDSNASWGESSPESASWVAEQINRAICCAANEVLDEVEEWGVPPDVAARVRAKINRRG